MENMVVWCACNSRTTALSFFICSHPFIIRYEESLLTIRVVSTTVILPRLPEGFGTLPLSGPTILSSSPQPVPAAAS